MSNPTYPRPAHLPLQTALLQHTTTYLLRSLTFYILAFSWSLPAYAQHGPNSELDPIETWLEAQSHAVSAYDVAARFGSSLPYASINIGVFNKAPTADLAIAALSPTHFVVAYSDVGNTHQGTIIVGEVLESNRTRYGPASVFNTAPTGEIDIALLSPSRFVLSYSEIGTQRGMARVGEVTDMRVTQYGAQHVFNEALTYANTLAVLGPTQFLVAFRDGTQGGYGTAIVGEVENLDIADFGRRHVFNASPTFSFAAAALSATHVVIAFSNYDFGPFQTAGAALVANVTDTSIRFGPPKVLDISTDLVAVAALDTSRAVLVYNKRVAIAEITNGETLHMGPSTTFQAETPISIAASALSADHFVLAYALDGQQYAGAHLTGTTQGQTISLREERVFNASSTLFISVAPLNPTDFAIVYQDGGNAFQGTTFVGTATNETSTTIENEGLRDLDSGSVPTAFQLEDNYPNPFNPSTHIRYTVPVTSELRLAVYDMLGRTVTVLASGIHTAGSYEITFDAGSLPSGTYLYRLETPEGAHTKTLQLLK